MDNRKTELVKVIGVFEETSEVRTLRMKFADDSGRATFNFLPGQMAEYSVFGVGDYTLSISSSPTRLEYLECSFRISDKPGMGLTKLRPGDLMALRGPYGNAFPIDGLRNKNIVLIAGELGLVSLRSLIWNIIDSRTDYKNITIIYCAGKPEDMVYKSELLEWRNMADIKTIYAVELCPDSSEWIGEIGAAADISERFIDDSDDTVAVVCGSQQMNERVVDVLSRKGFDSNSVYLYSDNKIRAIPEFDFPEAGNQVKKNEGNVFRFRQIEKNNQPASQTLN